MSQLLNYKDINPYIDTLTQHEVNKLIQSIRRERTFILQLMEEYSKLIAVYYGIDSQEVFENSRKDVLFKARSFVYFVLVFMYDVKKSVIARITGWDHATILYGIEHVVWMYNNLDDYHDFMNQVIGNEKMKQYINEIKNRKRKKVS